MKNKIISKIQSVLLYDILILLFISLVTNKLFAENSTLKLPSPIVQYNSKSVKTSFSSSLLVNNDLSITKTDNKQKYTVGNQNIYTIIVKNNGNTTIANASVKDAVPSGINASDMTYTALASSGSSTAVTGTQSGNINDIVTLSGGGEITYTVKIYIHPFFTGNLVNTATVTTPSGITDPNTSNNSATDTDTPGIDAVNDSFANASVNITNGGIAGNVLSNDLFNGGTMNSSLVNIAVINNGGITGLSISNNGNLSVPAGTLPNTYLVQYKVCELADSSNCDTATAIVQVYTDSDHDGISDVIDSDDDNDGILDTTEESCPNKIILFTENFGTGSRTNTTYTNYIYEPTPWNTSTNSGGSIDDGEYAIVNKVDPTVAEWAACYWINKQDHTPNDTDGRFALFNASFAPGEFYRRANITVPKNTIINLGFWALNVDQTNNCDQSNARKLPKIRAVILDASGNNIAAVNTGAITKNENWNEYLYNFNTGNNTNIQIVLLNDAEGGFGNDVGIDDIMVTIPCDYDGDGIPNYLDLNSDNDICPDSIEGDENIKYVQLNSDTSINTTTAGINVNGVPNPVNSGGIADINSNEGQGIGSSQNSAINGCMCYKPSIITGNSLNTTFGITSLGRAGINANNWPLVRKGGWFSLEAKTKGFVPNRVTTVQKNTLVPVEGMIVYDITLDCLSIFDGTGWKCIIEQTCPDLY